VTVFDRDCKFRVRTDLAGTETFWQILARITPAVVAAEMRAIAIETLADGCRTAWRPVAAEIDADARGGPLFGARFAVDLMRYPDDAELAHLSRATVLMGRDEAGRTSVTGEILWIDADRRRTVCEDSFCWMPEDGHASPVGDSSD
jgi:hypothetical protein